MNQAQVNQLVKDYSQASGWVLYDEYQTEIPFSLLDDPEEAEGLCVLASESFTNWLLEKNIQAKTVDGRSTDFYSDVADLAHTVTVIDNKWIVDWTAAQLGFNNFPLIKAQRNK